MIGARRLRAHFISRVMPAATRIAPIASTASREAGHLQRGATKILSQARQ